MSRIVWFRRDLRIADNAALAAAVTTGDPVVPVALAETSTSAGSASSAWRALSLQAMDSSLRARGNALVVRGGAADVAISALAAECGAIAVHCTRDWTLQGLAEEASMRRALASRGVPLHVSEGQLLVTPDALTTVSGRPYRVFTPYYRAWRSAWRPAEPLSAPARIPAPASIPVSDALPCALPHAPRVSEWWAPGETEAQRRLDEFAAGPVLRYGLDRDTPSIRGTSELSPRLAFGEVTPGQVVEALRDVDAAAAEPFLRQLAWREFAYHVLHHFPHTATTPLREEFAEFPWREDEDALRAWKAGKTGFPLVDAGMRQLAATGWMHNRVRLVCGSFLTKDLLVPWQTGEAYFQDRLVDFDPALNVFNWQWVAGSGADAAPYFRVFNPVTQQKRFDAAGEYVHTWIDVTSEEYSDPIVDHAEARKRALAAYAAVRDERGRGPRSERD